MNFSYEIDADGLLVNGTRRIRTAENENDFYWSDDKQFQRGVWRLENGAPVKVTRADDSVESIMLRMRHAPEIVATISSHMSANVPNEEQLALMGPILQVGSLLLMGSYQHALLFVRMEAAKPETPAKSKAALLVVEQLLQREIGEYYGQ